MKPTNMYRQQHHQTTHVHYLLLSRMLYVVVFTFWRGHAPLNFFAPSNGEKTHPNRPRTLVCLHMYVCMHVCMHVCVCVRACMYVCMCVCMYVCMYVCTYVRTYVCMYVCMYKCMYVCLYICMYVMYVTYVMHYVRT